MSIEQISIWIHTCLQALIEVIKFLGKNKEGCATLALVPAAFWAVWVFHKSKKKEAASRLHELFTGFYLSPDFRRLRINLEFHYKDKLRPLIERVIADENAHFTEDEEELLCDLDTALNYFEFILHLKQQRQISEKDRRALFNYWYQWLCAPERVAIRVYLSRFDYDAIVKLLAREENTGSRSRTQFIAVYGTLMEGQSGQEEAGVAGQWKRRGPCELYGVLYDLGSYPGLLPGQEVVKGELYESNDPAVLAQLDEFEGSEFVRYLARLKDPAVDCWIYFYNRRVAGKTQIQSGDWINYRSGLTVERLPV